MSHAIVNDGQQVPARRLIFPRWRRTLDGGTVPPVVLFDSGVLLGLFVVAGWLLWLSGAFNGAFGAEPDEPSHYVTALMIRDFIAAGLPGDPVAFAKDFYLRYPNVAFAMWPPVFHLFMGLWMLLFGADRMSVALMLASVTTVWAFLLYGTARQVIGKTGAVIAAFLLVTLPVTQKATASVMLDVALSIPMLGAMGAFAKYLHTQETKHAVFFGLWAAGAVLTKYNGLALAFVPLIAVVLTGRHDLWRSKRFWLPAGIVFAAAAPWYIAMRQLVQYAAEPGGPLPSITTTLAENFKSIVLLAGPPVFVLAAAGAVLAFRRRSDSEQHRPVVVYLSAVSVSMILSVWLFHSVVYPIRAERYLLPVAPPLLLLAAVASRHLLEQRRSVAYITMIIAAAVYAGFTFRVPQKQTSAWVKAADAVFATGLPDQGAVLVSGDGPGEGMLVAEFAMRDQRPNHFVVRANKLLASQTLMGQSYKTFYKTPQQLMDALDKVPISMAVFQTCSPKECSEHENLLESTVRSFPDRFRLLSQITAETGSPIRIYRIARNERKPVRAISIDMRHSLGVVLKSSDGRL